MWSITWRRRLQRRGTGLLEKSGEEIVVLPAEEVLPVEGEALSKTTGLLLSGGQVTARRAPQRTQQRLLTDVTVETIEEEEVSLVFDGGRRPSSRSLSWRAIVVILSVIALAALAAMSPRAGTAIHDLRAMIEVLTAP